MSYILDALQRADAERERGTVPGLNSQIVPPARRPTAPIKRWKPLHTAGVLVALLLLIAAGVWWWMSTSPAPVATATPAPAPSSPPPAMAPAVPPAAATAPVAPPPSMASAPPEAVQPILAPPRAEPPKPPPRPAATATAPAAPKKATPAPAVSASPAPAPAAAPATAAPAVLTKDAAPVRSFAELSPEARAQLPQVNVSGSTYSQNPALRMLIVNGKVLQEGQEIAPGFKLETIGQRSAVLNHQGVRYSIGY